MSNERPDAAGWYPTLQTEADRRLWDALRHLAQCSGFTVAIRRMRWPVQAITDYETKQVVVADDLGRVGALTRLAHEVAHVRIHATVLRPGRPQDRVLRELEAELVACAVLLTNRIEPASSSADFIANRAIDLTPHSPEELVTEIFDRLVPATMKICASVQDYLEAHPRENQPNRSADTVDYAAAEPDGPGH